MHTHGTSTWLFSYDRITKSPLKTTNTVSQRLQRTFRLSFFILFYFPLFGRWRLRCDDNIYAFFTWNMSTWLYCMRVSETVLTCCRCANSLHTHLHRCIWMNRRHDARTLWLHIQWINGQFWKECERKTETETILVRVRCSLCVFSIRYPTFVLFFLIFVSVFGLGVIRHFARCMCGMHFLYRIVFFHRASL